MAIRIPDVDGSEATRKICSAYGEQSSVIIELTGHAMENERDLALIMGCDDGQD